MSASCLDSEAAAAVRQRVAALESATGVEVVTTITERSDSYPEIPWKAFALGTSIASAGSVAATLFEPGWEMLEAAAQIAVFVLATGAIAALSTVWVKPFARLFLSKSRREAEVLQFAQAMFLESGLQATKRRNGILLLVSLFERQVTLVADHGVSERIGASGLDVVVATMTTRLIHGTLRHAMLDGLAKLEETLTAAGFRAQPDDVNELPDSVVQRRGSA